MYLIAEMAAEIPIESLPEGLWAITALFGVEGTLRLSENSGGMSIYIPKIDKLIRVPRDKRIRNEFTGSNHRDLARKYNMSETWIRKIVRAGPV